MSRRCPICGKPESPTERPFCSGRCADVDLHRWLSGAYAIPVEEGSENDDEGDRPPRKPVDDEPR